jgi:hypothetical protein
VFSPFNLKLARVCFPLNVNESEVAISYPGKVSNCVSLTAYFGSLIIEDASSTSRGLLGSETQFSRVKEVAIPA